MCRTIMIILLAIATQANTKDLAAVDTTNAQDKLIDRLMDKLVDSLLGLALPRALPASLGPRVTPSFTWTSSHTRGSSMSSGWLPHTFRGSISARSSRESELRESEVGSLGRRTLLGTGTALGLGLAMGERTANAGDTETFCGLALSPSSYGKNDPDACNKAVYTFEYPAAWKLDIVSKIEKGTKSIDGRVFNPTVRKKNEQAFALVLERAGEDNAGYTLGDDPKKTINSLAGVDFDLLEAIQGGSVASSKRESKGQKYFDFKITESSLNFLVTVTTFEGRLFAMVVKAPQDAFDKDQSELASIVKSFTLTGK